MSLRVIGDSRAQVLKLPEMPNEELRAWWRSVTEVLQRKIAEIQVPGQSTNGVSLAVFNQEVSARQSGDGNLSQAVTAEATARSVQDLLKADKGDAPDSGIKMTGERLLGRYSAGYGILQDIELGAGLTFGATGVLSLASTGVQQSIFNFTTTAVNLAMTAAQFCVAATAACTITLPPGASVVAGRPYIVAADVDSVVVAGDGTDTVNGGASVTIDSGESLSVFYDGAGKWRSA